MKGWTFFLWGAALAALLLFSGLPAYAQSVDKKSQSLPEVPVTYPGDSRETIIRRAQWMEGARKEGTVVWWGILNPNEAKAIIAGFNKIYPFIKVDYWRGRGEEIATKLEAEYQGSRQTVDVTLGGAPENYPRWRKMGMLEKFTDIIPGVDKIDKRLYGKFGDWFAPGANVKTPQYNTKLVAATEAPKSWEDLLNPKWKGQLGMEVESMDWAVLALSEGGWGLEKTEDFLVKLKEQKPRFIQGGPAAHSLLTAGDFKILAMSNLRYVPISQAKHAPVDWIRTNPVIVFGPSLALQKRGPHNNAARLFLEWASSPQGLQLWAEVSQTYVPRATTPMTRLLEGMHFVVRTEEVVLKIVELGLIKKFNKLLFDIQD